MTPRAGTLLRLWCLVAAAVLAGYARLLLNPDSLIVDFTRHAVDTAAPAVVPKVPGNDLTRLYLPAHQRNADAIRRSGRIPTWDPTGFGGRPLAGNPQSGLWYPPVWLAWWLADRPAVWTWLTLAHLVWAGWGAFVLARTLHLGNLPATLAGLAFPLSPYITAQVQAGHIPHVWAASWSGWAFSALIRGIQGESRAWWMLTAALSLSALAGHPQEAYLLTLATLAWSAIDIASCPAAVRPALFLRLIAALLAVIVLTAVAWLPQLLALAESRTASGLPSRATDPYTLNPANLLQLAWPLALGGPTDYRGRGNYAETQMGPGVLVLLLALSAIVFPQARRRAWPWAAIVLVSWLIAAGRPLGLEPILRSILPGFTQMRVSARTLYLCALALPILAAFGLDALERLGRPIKGLAALAAFELIVLTILIVRLTPCAALPGPDTLDQAIRRHLPDTPTRLRSPEHLVDATRINRLGLEVTDMNDWFQVRRAADLYETLYDLGSPPRVWTRFDPIGESVRRRLRQGVLDRMGVGLVLSADNLTSPPGPVIERITRPGQNLAIHANPSALPRAYVVPTAWLADDAQWRALLPWLDPRQSVLLSTANDPLPPGPRQPFTPAQYRVISNDRIQIDVETRHPGLLVIPDTHSPGWHARLDGREVPILRGNHAQRVVVLPNGASHQLEMTYDPPGLRVGLVASGLGWTLWLLGTTLRLYRLYGTTINGLRERLANRFSLSRSFPDERLGHPVQFPNNHHNPSNNS